MMISRYWVFELLFGTDLDLNLHLRDPTWKKKVFFGRVAMSG
jgi:hypothetical protein